MLKVKRSSPIPLVGSWKLHFKTKNQVEKVNGMTEKKLMGLSFLMIVLYIFLN